MSEVEVFLHEFEELLHKIVSAAHCGDEQAINYLDIVKEWLKNN
ncbi:hypothetical protein OMD49_29855 [Bacillus anthracis]|nr:hypothetical protein [Bacillus anthracis]MCW1941810.1 hypothetical protein [Bacillus anthracis]